MKYLPRRRVPRPSYRPHLEALERRDTPATFTVTTAADNVAGSLRAAITSANATPGLDTINFNIGGGGTQVLLVSSPLPTISDSVTLNAATQPGYTNAPLIQLDGTSAGTMANGLVLTSSGSTVLGLSVTHFNGDGIVLSGGVSNTLALNYIGLTPAGALAGNGLIGVLVAGGSIVDNIGGPGANVISGNGLIGVCVYGPGTAGNSVAGNLIGTNVAGLTAIPNGMAGVDVQNGAQSNSITGNVVSGNGVYGVLLNDPGTIGNTVAGNKIGVTANGNTSLANGFTGVFLGGGASSNTIGGISGAGRNQIGGSGGFGVFVDGVGTNGNLIGFDFVGTNFGGTAALPSGVAGIAIRDGAANTTLLDDVSDNFNDGILIGEAGTTGTLIQGCLIGVNATGTAALGNNYGVHLEHGAANTTLKGNILSGSSRNVVFDNSSGNFVQGNLIGTDVTGNTALGSAFGGLTLTNGAANNLIGGTTAASANIISGNSGEAGILLIGSTTTGNAIVGNLIGLNGAGTGTPTGAAQFIGIETAGDSGNIIQANVIAGNTIAGVYLGGSYDWAFGNSIGLNAAGTAAVPNGIGLELVGTANRVGGTTAAFRNFISGNANIGVQIYGTTGASGNVIEGNAIGVKADGVSPLGNGFHGVQITDNSFNNVIGGTAAGAGNLIANNGGAGVAIDIANSNVGQTLAGTGNTIAGNSIYNNAFIGIDLGGNGVTNNGNGVSGQSPNHFENYPVLTHVFTVGSTTVIQGTYQGFFGGTYRLEFFASPIADLSNHGKGKTFLGFLTIDTFGNVPFAVALTTGPLSGQSISATATNSLGDTSEFSADLTVP